MRATHVSIDVTSLAIEELPAVIKEDVEEYLENHPRSPAARLRPRMGMVGDIWLAFVGPKLRTGTSGLGQTPCDALEDFNGTSWNRLFRQTTQNHIRLPI